MNDIIFLSTEIYLIYGLLVLFFFFSIIKIPTNTKITKNLLFLINTKFTTLSCFFLVSLLYFYITEYDLLFLTNNKDSIYYITDFFIKKNVLINFCSIFLTILMLIFIFSTNLTITFRVNKPYEYVLVSFFSFSGFIFLNEVNDLFLFYLCFEIAALSIYVLIAFNTQSNIAIESVIKYYILGALTSCLLLLAIFFIYSVFGVSNFNDLLLINIFVTKNFTILTFFLFFSLLLILIVIFFKLGLFPFHFWLPNIYSGVTYKSLLFLFTIPKVGFLFFFISFYYTNLYDSWYLLNTVILFFSFFSIFVGTFGALAQKNIKKLLAYSSIVNLGYIFIVLNTATLYSIPYSIYYLIMYLFNIINLFMIIFSLKKVEGFYEHNILNLNQLSILYQKKPLLSIIFIINIFSLAGLPPFGPFYAKYLILLELINIKSFFIVFLILLINIISCFYYIRFIKILFFNTSLNVDKKDYFLISQNITTFSNFVLIKNFFLLNLLINLFFIINLFQCFYPSYLLNLIINFIL